MKNTEVGAVIRYMRGGNVGNVKDSQLDRDYFTRSRMATLGRKLEALQPKDLRRSNGSQEGGYILWLHSNGAEIPLRRGDWLELVRLILGQLERCNSCFGVLNEFSAMIVERLWKTVEHLHHSQTGR